MRFAECKNYQESAGLRFWQVSMLWQRRVRQALQPYDLTHTQFVILAVLEELSEQSVGITQKQIADFSMIDVMTVSSTVRLLEKKGLVCRLPNQKDTRANALSNTEKGRQRLAQAVVAVEQADKSFFFGSAAENVAFKARLTELLHKNLR